MSEENTGTPTPEQDTGGEQQAPDPIQNIKGEFGRKLGNVETQIQALTQTTQALMEQIKGANKPAPSPEENDEDLLYKDPKAYKQRLTSEVLGQVNRALETRDSAATERQQTVMSLVAEYPELNQAGSEFYEETMKTLSTLPKDVAASPLGYKTAVYQAAASLGLQPKSKRGNKPADNKEDFQFSGGKSKSPKKTNTTADIDPRALWAAELLGAVDTTNEKDVAELKKYADRKDWWRST